MTSPGTALAFGRFEWRPAQRLLLADGRPLALGSRALDVFAALAERRDRVVPKSELLDVVWAGLVVEENNLQVQVSALRKALGADVIATIPGRGYRFTAAVDGAAPVAVATTNDDAVAAPHGHGQAAAVPPGNLPQGLPPLIGRDDALRELDALVAAQPLVTIVGTGGIGKTRLALAAAAAQQGRWPDGVWWVEAAASGDAPQLPQAVAAALGITLRAPDVAALVAALRPMSLLLVLDNCEHVVEQVASLVQALRAGAPRVHVLVTSQELLAVPGEQVYRLPPLALPPRDAATPADERYGAIRLFAERARAGDRSFVVDDRNAAAVAEICRRLDGLPLAVELAAARVRQLGVHALHERLGEHLRLLGGGSRSTLRRHPTLRAALAWSHSLLGVDEQAVLRRLGVFVGGFSLELAQQVARDDDAGGALDEWAVLDVIGALVDKSLVAADPGEPVRYRLLETMRTFALEMLAERGETAIVQRRHARAVCAHFRAADDARFGESPRLSNAQLMQRMAPEIDNARAALDWAIGVAHDWPLAVALAGAAAPAFMQLGMAREHLPRLRALWPHVDCAEPQAQVTLLWRLGQLGAIGGLSRDERMAVDEEAVRRARSAGSRRRLMAALGGLGWSYAAAENFGAAEAVVDELGGLEAPDDPPFTRLPQLGLRAMILNRRGDYEGAVAVIAQQEVLLREAPGEGLNLAIVQSNLAVNLNGLGRHDEAAAVARKALANAERPRGLAAPAFELIHALVELGRSDEARAIARDQHRHWHLAPLWPHADSLALLAAAGRRFDDAYRLVGALARGLAHTGIASDRVLPRLHERLRAFGDGVVIDDADRERWQCEGAGLDETALLALALRLAE